MDVHAEELPEPEATGKIGTTRRTLYRRAGGLLFVAALLAMAVALTPGGKSGDRATVRQVAADEPTTTLLPSTTTPALPTTTVVDTSLPATTTTTVAVEVGHVSAQSGTLRLDATIEPASTLTATLLEIELRGRDVGGRSLVAGGDFGDGTGGMPGNTAVECMGDESNPSGTTAPSEETWTWNHAYRRPGRYTITLAILSAGCTGEQNRVQGQVVVIVAAGAIMSNGPVPPVVLVTQTPPTADQDPSWVYLAREASDVDGYVSRVEVDWGDASPPTVYEYPLSSCVDPGTRWEPSRQVGSDGHRYGAAGSYDVRTTVTSVGCDGAHRQVVSARTTVNAP